MILTLCVAIAAFVAKTEAWKTFSAQFEGEVMGRDFSIALAMALVFLMARYLLDKTLFAAVARRIVIPREKAKLLLKNVKRTQSAPAGLQNKSRDALSQRTSKGKKHDARGEKKAGEKDLTSDDIRAIDATVEKFKESFWKALVYTSFTAYGFYFMSSKSWFYDRSHFWHVNDQQDHCCPKHCTDEIWPECATSKFSFDVKAYYMIELGYYLQGIVSLLFWETRRKDFKVMMTHHIVTVTLIMTSHYSRMLRFGTMVFLLHDVSDIPLELAKASKYANMETLTNTFFAIFFLVWVLSRLVYFPLHIIRPAVFEVPKCPHISRKRFYAMGGFASLLISLLIMHIYWTYLIVKIFKKALFNKTVDDIREDDSDDD